MNRPLGLGTAALTGIQVGLALVLTRAVSHAVGPMQLAVLRYAVGVAVLLPFFLTMRRKPIARRDLLPVLGLGVVQFGVLIALLNASVMRITSGQAAVIFALFPLLTLTLSAAVGLERFGPRRIGGTVLAVAGVIICIGVTRVPADPVGAALAFGAVCSVLYRPYLARYPTLQVGTLAMLAAVAVLSLPALAEAPPAAVLSFTGPVWAGIVAIGLSSGAGYVLWLTALRNLPASDATLFLGLSPITAALLGVMWLGEPLGPVFGTGLVITLAGMILTLWKRRGQENHP